MFNFREDLSRAVPVDAADLETWCPGLSVADLLEEFAEWPDIAPDFPPTSAGCSGSPSAKGGNRHEALGILGPPPRCQRAA
jgi:hypothetical protein